MGLTVLEIEVGNPADPEVTEEIEFLIDSGAIYSVVPTPILQSLGVEPLTEHAFRLADGSKIVRKKGGALFKYGDQIGVADVIFGEEGDSSLLGAFTLEALADDACRAVGLTTSHRKERRERQGKDKG